MLHHREDSTPHRRLYTLLFSAWLLIPSFMLIYAYHASLLNAKNNFQHSCGELKGFLFERLHSNEALVAGLSAFLGASAPLDSDKASDYARHILSHYPHIEAIEFAQSHPLAASIGGAEQVAWHGASERQQAITVTFAEDAQQRIHRELGRDLNAQPLFRQAMQQASSHQHTVATTVFDWQENTPAIALLRAVPAPLTGGGRAEQYAILIITRDSLLRDAELSAERGLQLDLHLSQTRSKDTPATTLFAMAGKPASYLEHSLLPSYSLTDSLHQAEQHYYFQALKQVTSDDIDTSLLSKLFLAALLTGLLLLSYLRAIYRIERERVELTEKLHHKAFHDELTGVGNRTLIIDRLSHAIGQASRSGRKLAVLFLDLDRFKAVNDNHGHEVGDVLLQRFCARLSAAVRDSDTIGRLGGDEFVVILEQIKDPADAEVLANTLHADLCEPYIYQGRVLNIGVSIGIAYYPEDGTNCRQLLQKADEYMYGRKYPQRPDHDKPRHQSH